MLLGNRTNLDEAQQLGASKNIQAKREKAQEILEVLLAAGITRNSTAQATADALNHANVYTRQGMRWNKSNVRAPSKEAWAIHDEAAVTALSSNPNFGRFA